MKNAIIVHGKPGKKEYYDPKFPSASNYHWIPSLWPFHPQRHEDI